MLILYSVLFLFFFFFFFFNDTATTEIYTLSLHDALPICRPPRAQPRLRDSASPRRGGGSWEARRVSNRWNHRPRRRKRRQARQRQRDRLAPNPPSAPGPPARSVPQTRGSGWPPRGAGA